MGGESSAHKVVFLSREGDTAIHRISGGMVMVMDCFAIGTCYVSRIPSLVYLTFMSAQQKTTFFRIMANNQVRR